MAKYRKKPVVIEAIQYTETPDNTKEIMDFIGPQPACSVCGGRGEYEGDRGPQSCHPCNSRLIAIRTLEGTMYADWGDWIIKGIKGEFYPCKPDIFEATYERID